MANKQEKIPPMNVLLTITGVSADTLLELNKPLSTNEFRNLCSKAMLEVSNDISTPEKEASRNATMSGLLKWWKAGKVV